MVLGVQCIHPIFWDPLYISENEMLKFCNKVYVDKIFGLT